VAATSGRQPARLVKIGALTESWGPTTVFVGLREGLQERGYGENKDFVIGVRFTEGSSSELPHAARDLVAHGVDIIVASGRGPEAKAVHEALDLDGSRRPWPNGSAPRCWEAAIGGRGTVRPGVGWWPASRRRWRRWRRPGRRRPTGLTAPRCEWTFCRADVNVTARSGGSPWAGTRRNEG
jgi:hypothetical protein